jgi:hypothetical protein
MRAFKITAGKRKASFRELCKFNILPLASKFLLPLSLLANIKNFVRFQVLTAFQLSRSTAQVHDTDITMFQILTTITIKKESITLELNYPVIFHLVSKA